MTQRSTRHRSDLTQLVWLRALHEKAARVHYEGQRDVREQQQQRVERCRAEVLQAQQLLRNLNDEIFGAYTQAMAQINAYASSRKALIADLIERAEYGLLDAQEALVRANRAVDQAQQQWRHQQRRRETADKLLADTRVRVASEAESRNEREAEPITRPSLRDDPT